MHISLSLYIYIYIIHVYIYIYIYIHIIIMGFWSDGPAGVKRSTDMRQRIVALVTLVLL